MDNIEELKIHNNSAVSRPNKDEVGIFRTRITKLESIIRERLIVRISPYAMADQRYRDTC